MSRKRRGQKRQEVGRLIRAGRWELRLLLLLRAPQQPPLPSKGFPSTLFTAPASLQSKAYARVWRLCCRASGSSELPPRPRGPSEPCLWEPQHPALLEPLPGVLAGPSLVRVPFVVCQAQYWALGTRPPTPPELVRRRYRHGEAQA